MKNIVINPFDSKSIQNAINELNKYNSDLTKKCEQFVKELADVGINVGRQNCGPYTNYIVFSKQVNPSKYGCTAIFCATNTGMITAEWQTKDGIKTAYVNPILMEEFGSGWYAEDMFDSGVGGQGTFPGQTHAFDSQWSWKDLNGELHSSRGEKPYHPMFNAYNEMFYQIRTIARRVFG